MFAGQSVNQLAFGVGALAGLGCAGVAFLLWRFLRPAAPAWLKSYDATHMAAFEQWPTTALVLDPGSAKVVAMNPAGLRSFGYTLEEVRALNFSELFSVEGVDPRALVKRVQESNSRTPLEMRQICQDGSSRNVEAHCYPLQLDNKSLLAVAVHDVTVRRKAENHLLEKHQQLDHLAHHDQLTGLPNRLYLQAHLPVAIEEAKKNSAVLAVLFLDLDRFKHVNDSRGHETGDKLLKTVAQRIRSTMRAEDVVVRMGGDEFVVILKGVKSSRAGERGREPHQPCALGADGRRRPHAGHHRQHRGRALPARRRRHGRAAAPLRHRDVPGEGPRPQQLPALRPRHGQAPQGAHRDRVVAAHRAVLAPARRALPADRRHRDPSAWWRSRRCCAGSTRTTATCAPSAS